MDLSASNVGEAMRLLRDPRVTRWHDYVSRSAKSLDKDYLLFVPCAKSKPYPRPTKSFFYNWLWKFLDRYSLRSKVFLCTVSEPFALFPETDYLIMPDYELSPLVLKGDPDLLEHYVSKLGKPIADFLARNAKNHDRVLAYVRPDSTHARFLERANRLLGKEIVEPAVQQEHFVRVKKDHPRMWHLDWMIFLQSVLLKELRT